MLWLGPILIKFFNDFPDINLRCQKTGWVGQWGHKLDSEWLKLLESAELNISRNYISFWIFINIIHTFMLIDLVNICKAENSSQNEV
jgi:hypothetical protein